MVGFEIEEQDLSSYLRAADFLNISNVDIVCLQHEFGIFGGTAGGHIPLDLQLSLGRARHRPIVWQLSILQVIACELSTGQILHLLPTQHRFKCPTGFER